MIVIIHWVSPEVFQLPEVGVTKKLHLCVGGGLMSPCFLTWVAVAQNVGGFSWYDLFNLSFCERSTLSMENLCLATTPFRWLDFNKFLHGVRPMPMAYGGLDLGESAAFPSSDGATFSNRWARDPHPHFKFYDLPSVEKFGWIPDMPDHRAPGRSWGGWRRIGIPYG